MDSLVILTVSPNDPHEWHIPHPSRLNRHNSNRPLCSSLVFVPLNTSIHRKRPESNYFPGLCASSLSAKRFRPARPARPAHVGLPQASHLRYRGPLPRTNGIMPSALSSRSFTGKLPIVRLGRLHLMRFASSNRSQDIGGRSPRLCGYPGQTQTLAPTPRSYRSRWPRHH